MGKPKKRGKATTPKPTILKTDDELIDDLFSPKVRKELKKVAQESRPKEAKA